MITATQTAEKAITEMANESPMGQMLAEIMRRCVVESGAPVDVEDCEYMIKSMTHSLRILSRELKAIRR